MRQDEIEQLGAPDVQFVGLQVWVHGRQYPEALDASDGNWLRVTAHCGGSGASVWVRGAIVETTGFRDWADELAQLTGSFAGEAALTSHEPYLDARVIAIDRTGHGRLRVSITPEPLAQQHVFEFAVDQSYLPSVEQQCRRLVAKYPVR